MMKTVDMTQVYGSLLPKYETLQGQELELRSMGKGSYLVCIQNTSEREFLEYGEVLQKAGFQIYSENRIPSGVEEDNKPNLFYVYTKDVLQVFLSLNTVLKTVRIVYAYPEPLPAFTKLPLEEGDVFTPSITQIQIEIGMSYVIRLKDGGFIVIDGGTYVQSDAERLYTFMKDRTPKGKKPVISAWMFTHPDPDHIQLATTFISQYAEKIEIKAFAYNFPDCDILETKQNDQLIKQQIEDLENHIKVYCPDSVTYTLHTGQTYYFKGVEVEILMTQEDVYPIEPSVYNDTTAVWRMNFDNGGSFLVLGDCTHQLSKQLAMTYGGYLKSDILQLAHHGLIGGDKYLYQLIDPEACFWATFEDRFNGHYSRDKYQWCLGENICDYNAWIRDETVRIREHYHNSVTTTLEMKEHK